MNRRPTQSTGDLTKVSRGGAGPQHRKALLALAVAALVVSSAPAIPRLVRMLPLPSGDVSEKPPPGIGDVALAFEANMGQDDPEVRFKARAGAATLFLTNADAALVGTTGDVLRWRMVGANPASEVVGMDLRPGVVNDYRSPDPAQWHTGIPTYARVAYRGAYPGIDAVFYGNGGEFEYDLLVAPGADPGAISLAFEGARDLRLDDAGDLLLTLPNGEVRHRRPVAYQDSQAGRRQVEARYILRGHEIAVATGEYDRGLPLVIDPLIYSTFIGGEEQDNAASIAVDGAGQAVITGRTSSPNYPTRNAIPGTGHDGFDDAYVTKFNATGTDLIYSTYFKATTDDGGPTDQGQGVTVDGSGNAYVTGYTESPFPTTPGAFQTCPPELDPNAFNDRDAFVAKLSPVGSLVYATCIGGLDTDTGNAIAVDVDGNAYVTGETYSTNFPVLNPIPGGAAHHGPEGGNDGFIAKLNSTGTGLLYSSYIGGTGFEFGRGVGVDAQGAAYVYGSTSSTDFPVVNALDGSLGGNKDLYVSKLAPAGTSLTYSTYLGGSANDGDLAAAGGFEVDAGGNAYVAAQTASTDFPVAGSPFQAVSAGGNDIVVAKLDPSGQALVFATYLGGSGSDGGTKVELAIDGDHNLYVVSNSASANFPVGRADPITPAPPAALSGHVPQILTKLSADGSTLLSSTYFGMTLSGVSAIAVDAAQNLYVGGMTRSPSFPITPGVYQTVLAPTTLANQSDAFVSKLQPAVGFLRVTTSPALPSQITVDGVPRTTYGIINLEAAPGSHEICFREVEGFATPPCQVVNVTAGVTAVVEGAFVPKGFLQVQTSPPTPAKITVDGVARDDWGIFTDFGVGSHEVCFGPVADLAPPPCQTVAVAAGATTSVTGTYAPSPGAPGEPAGNGALRVTTNPPLPSQISVDGVPRATYGLINLQVPAGSHEICFRPVEGFSGPTCQSAVVTAGATTQFEGTFVAKGFLQAVSSPALPVPVYVDGVPRDDWGLFTDYAVGSHQVCFGSVAGRIRPACQTVSLTAGSTVTVTGTFLPA